MATIWFQLQGSVGAATRHLNDLLDIIRQDFDVDQPIVGEMTSGGEGIMGTVAVHAPTDVVTGAIPMLQEQAKPEFQALFRMMPDPVDVPNTAEEDAVRS